MGSLLVFISAPLISTFMTEGHKTIGDHTKKGETCTGYNNIISFFV